jgi:hypothetical protein
MLKTCQFVILSTAKHLRAVRFFAVLRMTNFYFSACFKTFYNLLLMTNLYFWSFEILFTNGKLFQASGVHTVMLPGSRLAHA